MLYVLNVSPLIITSCSVVDNILLVPTSVVELMTMTYSLVCDDIVQLTLILVSFKIYVITLDGRPLGTRKKEIFNRATTILGPNGPIFTATTNNKYL